MAGVCVKSTYVLLRCNATTTKYATHAHNTLSCASVPGWLYEPCNVVVMLCFAGAGGFETIEYCIYCEYKHRAHTNVDAVTNVSLTKQFT